MFAALFFSDYSSVCRLQFPPLLLFVLTFLSQFDVTDPARHFELAVPRRAIKCDVLFKAVLALSSLHLRQISSFDPSLAQAYYSRSKRLLLPLLSDDKSPADENVLASLVILRKYEEMNGNLLPRLLRNFADSPLLADLTVGQEHGHSLVDASALYDFSNFTVPNGLGQAAFWQSVSQDVYMSLSKAVPPRMDVSLGLPIVAADENSDCGWAKQIIWITLCILTFCFGDGPRRLSLWDDLSQKVTAWDQSKPGSFDPLFFRDRLPNKGCHFPEIFLSASWHGK